MAEPLKKSKLDKLSDAIHMGKEMIHKMTESNPQTPSKPPSFSPSYPSPGLSNQTSLPNPYDDLTNSMHRLSVRPESNNLPGDHPPGSFVGGFSRPDLASNSFYSAPPPMPVPYDSQPSMTMQYAMGSNSLSPPSPMGQRPPMSASVSSGPRPPNSGPGAIPPRASSVPPPSPSRVSSSGGGAVQCNGITKAGTQCTRQVKIGTADPDLQTERFCHQHQKEVLSATGFYSRKKQSEWVLFEKYIPAYLQEDTQASLRSEMLKERSAADVPGYIYTFEIRDPKNTKEISLKVGRAVNLVKRIDQWGKQCTSKEQVVRGFWPNNVEDEDGNRGALMKGLIKTGQAGGWCHRLERLIHLELGDLALNEPYLDPTYPQPQSRPLKAKGSDTKKPCKDCGQMHQEIFTFTRPQRGKYKGKEWEEIVWPVIEKWGDFVVEHV